LFTFNVNLNLCNKVNKDFGLRYFKKAIRVLKYVLLSLLFFILIIAIVVNTPFAQKIITAKLNNLFAEKGWPVHVGELSLAVTGKISVVKLEIKSSSGDTIVYAGNVNIKISSLALFSNRVLIQNAELKDAVVNWQKQDTTLISMFQSSSPQTSNDDKRKSSWDLTIKEVHLNNIRFLYTDSLKGILIRQTLQSGDLTFDNFSILKKQIDVDHINLKKADGFLSVGKAVDTLDTDSSPSTWKFSARSLELTDINYMLEQPDETQKTSMSLKHAEIAVKDLDLSKRELNILQLNLSNPNVLIETLESRSPKSFAEAPEINDTVQNSWSFVCSSINIGNGVFNYVGNNPGDREKLNQWLPVTMFNSEIKDIKYSENGLGFHVNQLSFGLNEQAFLKSGEINFSSDSSGNGNLSLEIIASINSENQKLFSKNDDVRLSSLCYGSTDSLQIRKFSITSTSGINFSVAGYVTDLLHLTESRLNLEFKTGEISREQTHALIALSGKQISLPAFEPISYSGSVSNSFLKSRFNVLMQSASGIVSFDGNYDVNKKSGKAYTTLTNIKLGKIFGDGYPTSMTGSVLLNGGINSKGMMSGNCSIGLETVLYNNINYHNINFDATVIDDESTFSLVSDDTSLTCNLKGLLGWKESERTGELSGSFSLNNSHANLLSGQISLQGNIVSGFRKNGNDIQSSVDLYNLTIVNMNNHVDIDTFLCNLNMSDTLVRAQIRSDFMSADFLSRSSFVVLKNAAMSLELRNLFSLDSTDFLKVNVADVIPVFNLDVVVNYDSVFQFIYPDSIFHFDTLRLAISRKGGEHNVTGESSLSALKFSDFKTYGAKMLMEFVEHKFNFSVNIDSIDASGKRLGESVFVLDVLPSIASSSLSILSPDDKPLFLIGAEMLKKTDKVVLTSTENDWILNGNEWKLSPSEFLVRENISRDISADLHLEHADMKMELTGRESKGMNLNLENIKLTEIIPPEFNIDLPEGLMNANVNYSGGDRRKLDYKLEVKKFSWKGVSIDDIQSAGRLEGDSTGILIADISALLNDTTSISLKLNPVSNPAEKKYRAEYTNVPVKLLQSAVSEYIDSLTGSASGQLDLRIENQKTILDGEMRLKQAGLNILKLNSHFSIPDDKLVIRHSNLTLDRFTVLDSVRRPLFIDGAIAFENPDSISVDLNVKTDNLRVMNTTIKDNPNFFGTIVVNSGLDISGPVKRPAIKGVLILEEGTNITYKYVEDLSVMETEKTVTFAKIGLDSMMNNNQFNLKEVTGMPSMQTTIEINPKSVFKIEYSSGFDIDVKVSGKGLLNYSTLPNNNISLAGSYEINSGTSELKFTGWPMKKFTITPGSSIRWDGAYDDPLLNIEAISKVKGSYLNPIDNKDRTVDFIVSMKLLDQLSQLKIIFDVKSNDQYITSVFNSLSSDEVMRQAINLLIFESVDLPGMQSSTNYMSAQMNSFWESQLNNITKTRVKNVDISFGIDTHKQKSSSGAEEEKTSLSYEMEKKFYNDRASVKISGRLNDVSQVQGKHSSNLIENFSFEYALDTLNKKYMNIFRKQDYEDILEGDVIKSGVGFIYRKSYHNLSDIWKRKSKKRSGTVPNEGKSN
jgi:translocation and assembly module TamB